MNFGMIILNQSIKKKQSYFIWILTALLFLSKLRIFTDIAQGINKGFDTSSYNEKDRFLYL